MRIGRRGVLGASLAVVCTWGSTAIGAIAAATLAVPTSTPTTTNGAASVLAACDPNRCVEAFSKDICEGVLFPGAVSFGSCTAGGVDCRTVCVDGATWEIFLQSNQQQCSNNGRCDEAIGKDGRLKAEISYIMRLHEPCPYRACFSGRWELEAADGTVYAGEVFGTIGVGSHRPSACPLGGRDCERCLDVSMFDFNTWRLGVEAQFRGARVNNPTAQQDELCFSLSGDFLAPVSGFAPWPNPSTEWRFFGTADGAHVYCN